MRIPDVRERLVELAEEHQLDELVYLASQLRRRYNGRKPAEPHSTPVSPELAGKVRAYVAVNPDLSLHEVAETFGINQGRVSEFLFGKRT